MNDLNIDNGNNGITLTECEGKCHIMIDSWGEVTGESFNKTQIKRIIKWLEKWVKEKEKGGLK